MSATPPHHTNKPSNLTDMILDREVALADKDLAYFLPKISEHTPVSPLADYAAEACRDHQHGKALKDYLGCMATAIVADVRQARKDLAAARKGAAAA